MIPKRAFFTWVGDKPLPWLRQLSIDSFAKFNPDWDVDLIRVDVIDGLRPAQSTDIARYRELYENGGFYFDTDIVFFGAFPEALLVPDVAVTMDKSAYEPKNTESAYPGFTNLAVLGAVAGSPFFGYVHETAVKRLEWLEEDNVDLMKHHYQGFGVALLDRTFLGKTMTDIGDQFGVRMANIPLDLVLPIRWNETHKLFNGTVFETQDETIGVHWYGGTYDSKRYQQQTSLDTFESRNCYLSNAIKRSLA